MTEDPRTVSVDEAKSLLDRGYRYLDVRRPEEYDAGHPAGALNVPVMLSGGGGMVPNAEFAEVMRALFPLDAKLVVGCHSGKRSARAAQELAALGYDNVVDMRAGFGGVRDAFGKLREPGWADAGQPTELTTTGGAWAELRRRAGR
jgi:rhodanese-related sulfurtransferase